ncbi:MAG: YlxR family protein [Gaiellaceae bacterium]
MSTTSNPIRTCAGCGRRGPQAELQRFHEEAGSLIPGAGDGRGVYTCRRLPCFERAISRRAFNRILRSTVRVDPDLSRLYTGA